MFNRGWDDPNLFGAAFRVSHVLNEKFLPSLATSHRVLRILQLIWLGGVIAGLIVLLQPIGEHTPLVSPDGWQIEGDFFQNDAPVAGEVSHGIRSHPDARFFRSWSPENGHAEGSLTTALFDVPEYIAIPYAGFPIAAGMTFVLQCATSGEEMAITSGNPRNDWVERVMRIPQDWCSGQASLVAISTSTDHHLMVGTPFKTTRLNYWRESGVVIAFMHLLVVAPFFVLWGAGTLIFRRMGLQPYLVVLGPSVVISSWGLMNFFLAYGFGDLQPTIVVLVTLAAGVYLAIERREFMNLLRDPEIGSVASQFFWVSMLFVLILYVVDSGLGGWAANYRFWPSTWGSDNQLQPMLAEKLYQGESLLGWNPSWRTSDRPPLLMGLILLSRPFWDPLLELHQNSRLLVHFQQITTICAMAFWVMPVWFLVQTLTNRRSRFILAYVLVGTSSFILFNTIFTWPKLLAGALATITYLILIQLPAQTGRRADRVELTIGAVAAALALMSHGGVVFGLIPVAILMLTPRYWPGWRTVLPAGILAVSMLIPWTLWQQLVDPPGNSLIKSAFGGTFGFGEEDIGVMETIARAYKDITFSQWVDSRIVAFATYFKQLWSPIGAFRSGQGSEIAMLRKYDQWYLFASFKILNVGWLVIGWLVLSRVRGREVDPREGGVSTLAVVGVSGVALSGLLTLSNHNIISNESYLSVLAIFVALATAISNSSIGLTYVVLGCQVLYMSFVWHLLPLVDSVSLHLDTLLGCVGALLALYALLSLEIRRPANNDGERTQSIFAAGQKAHGDSTPFSRTV